MKKNKQTLAILVLSAFLVGQSTSVGLAASNNKPLTHKHFELKVNTSKQKEIKTKIVKESKKIKPVKGKKIRTQESIISNYEAKLTKIQNQTYSDLNKIIEKARTEYNKLPKKKQNKMNKYSIVIKYFNQAKSLEKSTDNQVNAIIAKLKRELKANKHKDTSAELIKSYYNQTKSEVKNSILSKLNSIKK